MKLELNGVKVDLQIQEDVIRTAIKEAVERELASQGIMRFMRSYINQSVKRQVSKEVRREIFIQEHERIKKLQQ